MLITTHLPLMVINEYKLKILYLYFNLVCEGRSRELYCFERALRSFSPRPCPPLAGSKVGRAAVVIFMLGPRTKTNQNYLTILILDRTYIL